MSAKARAAAARLAEFSLPQSMSRPEMREVAYGLIRSAAAFAQSLKRMHAHEELERRALRFEHLTRGASLEQARAAACVAAGESLSRFTDADGVYLPLGVWREAGMTIDLDKPFVSRWPEVTINPGRLAQLLTSPVPDVARNLAKAIGELTAFASLEPPPRGLEELQRYVRELSNLRRQVDAEQLFGCSLLRQWEGAFDPERTDQETFDVLADRAREDLQGAVAAVQNAAKDLCFTAEGDSLAVKKTVKQKRHHGKEERPAEYVYGPLEGTLAQLDAALHPGNVIKGGRKRIRKEAEKGKLWICGEGHCYEAYLKSESKFEMARKQLQESKASAERAEKPPADG